jgi:hypothetical protein
MGSQPIIPQSLELDVECNISKLIFSLLIAHHGNKQFHEDPMPIRILYEPVLASFKTIDQACFIQSSEKSSRISLSVQLYEMFLELVYDIMRIRDLAVQQVTFPLTSETHARFRSIYSHCYHF